MVRPVLCAALVTTACRSEVSLPAPELTAVTPSVISNRIDTTVELVGQNFFPVVRGSPTRAPERLDASFDVEVADRVVTAELLDPTALRVVLAAGLSPGAHDVTVVTPAGDRATLANGLRVVDGDCASLPIARAVTVAVQSTDDLASALAALEPDTVVLVEDGVYDIDEPLTVSVPGVSLRARNPHAAVFDGRAADLGAARDDHALLIITAPDVVVADLAFTRAPGRAVRVTGAAAGAVLYNLDISDTLDTMVEIGPADGAYPDGGLLACSSLGLTGASPVHDADRSIYGVRGAAAAAWGVVSNRFEEIWSARDQSVGAIRFRTTSRNLLIERNWIVNSFAGVHLGVKELPEPEARPYGDDACANGEFADFVGGLVRNNFIAGATGRASSPNVEAGISLWKACDTRVLHNSIMTGDDSHASVEWRWLDAENGVVVVNNLLRGEPNRRDSEALALEDGNLVRAPPAWVVDAAGGDLHLVDGAGAIGAGVSLPDGWCDHDIDGQSRDDSARDVGADEI